jgi:hypothetical protein
LTLGKWLGDALILVSGFLHQDLNSEGKSLITSPPYSLASSSSSRIQSWRDAGGAWCFRLSQRVKIELSMTILNPLRVWQANCALPENLMGLVVGGDHICIRRSQA